MQVRCDNAWFVERDIDVWIAEELRVNPKFCRMLLEQCGRAEMPKLPAVKSRPSVCDETGETDVEAIFETFEGGRFALLVENKIEHRLGDEQLARYLKRGDVAVGRQKWVDFQVLVFAPRQKLVGFSTSLDRIATWTFEEAAKALRDGADDPRTKYRASFLDRAAEGKAANLEELEPWRAEFWERVREMARREFGDFFLFENRLPKTTYITARCADLPAYVRLDLKGHMGEVELAFKNGSWATLAPIIEPLKPPRAELVVNKKSVSLRIAGLQPFLISDGPEVVDTAARAAFSAAQQLLQFCKDNRSAFDFVYNQPNSKVA